MPGGPDQEVLRQAEGLAREAVEKEPLLLGRTRRMLNAAAYYIVATKLGGQVSIFDVAEMFDVSDEPLRKVRRLMASTLGIPRTAYYTAERTREGYDIYAEILKNDGANTRDLISKVHLSTKYLMKSLSFLLEKKLLVMRKDGNQKLYFPTERGYQYLEAYSRLREVVEGG